MTRNLTAAYLSANAKTRNSRRSPFGSTYVDSHDLTLRTVMSDSSVLSGRLFRDGLRKFMELSYVCHVFTMSPVLRF
jgi:hypothetical protein